MSFRKLKNKKIIFDITREYFLFYVYVVCVITIMVLKPDTSYLNRAIHETLTMYMDDSRILSARCLTRAFPRIPALFLAEV